MANTSVYDCTIFLHELDLLEIRLAELEDVVDGYVVVEAAETFSGKPKPLYLGEALATTDRFARWADRIIRVALDYPVDILGPWGRENYSRNAVLEPLAHLPPTTHLLLSDLDEIPRADAVAQALIERPDEMLSFEQPLSYYYLNLRASEYWHGTRMVRLDRAIQHSPSALRGYNSNPPVLRGGWHYSYTGGDAAVLEKIRAYSHAGEVAHVTPERIHDALLNCEDLTAREGMVFTRLPINEETVPRYVLENRARFAHLLLEA